MTASIRADAGGTFGALQVAGVDKLLFGSDNSGQGFGFRNRIINGGFNINQRTYVSGAAVGAGLYALDRWKMAASGDTMTFSTTANKTTVTIPASKVLQQVIEGLNLVSGTYTLSWEGTAQGKIGAGSYGNSGITGTIVGGTDTTIEFGPGTLANVQLEFGSIASSFERRPVGTELALCERYFQSLTGVRIIGYNTSSNSVSNTVTLTTTMRASPTTATSGVSYANASSLSILITNTQLFRPACIVTSTGTGSADFNITLTAEL